MWGGAIISLSQIRSQRAGVTAPAEISRKPQLLLQLGGRQQWFSSLALGGTECQRKTLIRRLGRSGTEGEGSGWCVCASLLPTVFLFLSHTLSFTLSQFLSLCVTLSKILLSACLPSVCPSLCISVSMHLCTVCILMYLCMKAEEFTKLTVWYDTV